jgi:hypothetical protein
MKLEMIEDENLSRAWARAVQPMLQRRGPKEIAPLCVSITGFDDGVVREDARVRRALDATLTHGSKQNCHTVANTLFPHSLWNPKAPREMLFKRYAFSLPRLMSASTKNRHGLYFQRMTSGWPAKHPNQLDFVIANFLSRKGVRRSALQLGVYNAHRDLTAAAQRGFPCLQQISFAPLQGKLSVNAFYATQYAFERAYGNYLGLCWLGRFVAHELELDLARVTCFTGILLRDDLPVGSARTLGEAIEQAVGKATEG